MTLIKKVQGHQVSKINKYLSISKGDTKTLGPSNNFHNKNAASKAIETGGGHAIVLADSNGDFKFTDDTACSFSFWIKAGWDTNNGGSVVFFAIGDLDATAYFDDEFLLYFYEPHNRLYCRFGSDSSNYRQNFWHFHDGGLYAAAQTASGGPNPWSSTARGNVGNDDYTMITLTKTTANSSDHPDFTLYWNATDCGEGFYRGGSGGGTGTANIGSSTDKRLAFGAGAHLDGVGGGNNAETKYQNLTIWNKELSSAEVAELYNGGAPMHVSELHSAYANCVGWYTFQNDGEGEVEGTESFSINGNSSITAK